MNFIIDFIGSMSPADRTKMCNNLISKYIKNGIHYYPVIVDSKRSVTMKHKFICPQGCTLNTLLQQIKKQIKNKNDYFMLYLYPVKIINDFDKPTSNIQVERYSVALDLKQTIENVYQKYKHTDNYLYLRLMIKDSYLTWYSNKLFGKH